MRSVSRMESSSLHCFELSIGYQSVWRSGMPGAARRMRPACSGLCSTPRAAAATLRLAATPSPSTLPAASAALVSGACCCFCACGCSACASASDEWCTDMHVGRRNRRASSTSPSESTDAFSVHSFTFSTGSGSFVSKSPSVSQLRAVRTHIHIQ